MVKRIMVETLRRLGLDIKVKESLDRFVYWLDPRLRSQNAAFLEKGVPDKLPVPPPQLICLVSGHRDMQMFYRSGEKGFECIRRILQKNGLDMAGFGSILDFGCGCGRVIRHWKGRGDVRIHGTDRNPRLVAWCRDALDFAEFRQNGSASRLDYPDETFDFIYTISVFTHLAEGAQRFWISELTRVLKRGGHLYLTVNGRSGPRSPIESADRGRRPRLHQLSSAQRRAFDDGRMVIVNERLAESNACAAFHPQSYVRSTLCRGLRVVDFTPDGAEDADQDAFLLQRP